MSEYSNLKNYIKGKRSIKGFFGEFSGEYILGGAVILLTLFSKECEKKESIQKEYDAPVYNAESHIFLANHLKSIEDKFR